MMSGSPSSTLLGSGSGTASGPGGGAAAAAASPPSGLLSVSANDHRGGIHADDIVLEVINEAGFPVEDGPSSSSLLTFDDEIDFS